MFLLLNTLPIYYIEYYPNQHHPHTKISLKVEAFGKKHSTKTKYVQGTYELNIYYLSQFL